MNDHANDFWGQHVSDYTSLPSPPFGATLNGRGAINPRWSVQERVLSLPSALASFPGTSISPVRILVIDNMARDVNLRPRQAIPESPPRFIDQSPTQVHSQGDSKLTQDEQKKALEKLKKEIYNPTPKRIIQRLSLYYRDNTQNNSMEKGKEIDEDGKRCAVCLEDFEPKQIVVLTPCSHMFHEECIVPWVKSHGQCPVCRFAICERIKESGVPSNNNPVNDLISFIRAINEARGRPTRGTSIPYWF